MEAGLIGAIIAGCAGAGAGFYSLYRNGKAAAEKYGKMEQKVDDIRRLLFSPDIGVNAINNKIADREKTCAKITGVFGEKIGSLEAVVYGRRNTDKLRQRAMAIDNKSGEEAPPSKSRRRKKP